jgi:hypothetical protein
MDADVMITIAFCLEAALFALAGGMIILGEVRKARAEKARAEAAAAGEGEPSPTFRDRPQAPTMGRPQTRRGL